MSLHVNHQMKMISILANNNKEKKTWTETLNTAAIMEYYFLSRPVDKEDKPVRR